MLPLFSFFFEKFNKMSIKIIYIYSLILFPLIVCSEITIGQTKNELFDFSKQAWATGDFKNAELFLNKMLSLKDSLTERNKFAVYNRLGIINKDIGKYDAALDNYKKAEQMLFISKSDDYSLLSLLYNNIANVYVLKGDNEKALQFYNEALMNLKESALTKKEKEYKFSQIYSNIGVVNIGENNYSEAITFFKISQQIKSKNSFDGIGSVYVNLAGAYEKIEDYKKAEFYYLKSIEEWNHKKNTENTYKSAIAYTNYSSLLIKLGKKEEALHYFSKGQEIYIQNYGQRHPYTSRSYITLGDFYSQEGNYEIALYYYQKSIISDTRQFNDSNILSHPDLKDVISDIQLLRSLKKKAETILTYTNTLKNPIKKIKYLKAGNNTIELALKDISNIRHGYLNQNSKLNITKDEKAFYFLAAETSIKLYELTKDEKYKFLAYSYVQKSKASLLIEEISQNKAFSRILPDSIRIKKTEIESDIYSFKKLLFDENEKTNPDKEKVDKWSHSLFELNNEYEELMLEIETNHPDYKQLIDKINIRSLENLQENLKSDETIIEYSLSSKEEDKNRKLFIFTITKKSINYYQSELDTSFVANINFVRNQMNKKEGQVESIEEFNELNSKLFGLYKVLIQPVEKWLPGNKIFIIPDEEIAYLSFDALLKSYQKQKIINYAALHFLIYDYCFSYAYASGLLFQKIPHYPKSNYVYAFAPDYSGTNLSGTRFQFGKLENTENEINAILHWFKGEALIGRAANEKFFKRVSSEGGIFHFAMHASAEKDNPDFSFLAITQKDATEQDGYFYNYEIAMMNMKATMVVLSGCNTGDGIISSGEGVMSLTRNFILAGVPSIIYSLWEVQDETSVVIMNKFYEKLSQGLPKNEALRAAKLNYIKSVSPTLVNPYFWSGYIQTGNPAPITNNNKFIYLIITILLLLYPFTYYGIYRYRLKRNTKR